MRKDRLQQLSEPDNQRTEEQQWPTKEEQETQTTDEQRTEETQTDAEEAPEKLREPVVSGAEEEQEVKKVQQILEMVSKMLDDRDERLLKYIDKKFEELQQSINN